MNPPSPVWAFLSLLFFISFFLRAKVAGNSETTMSAECGTTVQQQQKLLCALFLKAPCLHIVLCVLLQGELVVQPRNWSEENQLENIWFVQPKSKLTKCLHRSWNDLSVEASCLHAMKSILQKNKLCMK